MTVRVKAVLAAAAAAGALLLAAGFGMLGERLVADQRAFTRADRAYALGQASLNQWDAVEGYLAKPADNLLSLKDDRAYRKALALFWKSQPGGSAQWFKTVSFARRALLTIAGNDGEDPSRRSSSLNAVGILEFQGVLVAAGQGDMKAAQRHLRASTQAFTKAVILDDGNAEARHNLELLQMLNGSQSQKGSKPAKQVGSRPPGNGY